MGKLAQRGWLLAWAAVCSSVVLGGCYPSYQGAMYSQSRSPMPGTTPSARQAANGYMPNLGARSGQIAQASFQSDMNTNGEEIVPVPRGYPGRPGPSGSVELPPMGPNGPMMGPMGPGGPMVSEVGAAAGCPKELRPVSHPPYTVSPPDILYIDAVRLIPKPPYRLESLEVVLLSVTDTLPNAPILGQYVISPEGMLSLGFNYGAVRVGGLTLDQAQTAIRNHLSKILRNPQVTLALAQFRGIQQVRGQHLVRPDGTIGLGTYGSVYVSGMTLGQAKCVIEKYLSQYLQDPQVAVDVLAYNSKVYYVIYDGAGFGQQIFRLPATGNETVLDAISQVQGLAAVSSKKRIWLARPAPDDLGCSQVLPVDWGAITQGAVTNTNYQVFPGDRIYVDSNCLICFDNYLSMLLAPVERMLGITLLGAFTYQAVRGNVGGFGI